MPKFVIVLSTKNKQFFYSIEYMTTGVNKLYSRYFAAAFFFDNEKSALQEYEQFCKDDSIIRRLKTDNPNQDFTNFTITINQIQLAKTATLFPFQQPSLGEN